MQSSIMPEPALDIDGVTHRYGKHVALRDVSLRVSPGALFGLIGPNGSGKTTLFRILMTLLPPGEGAACVWNHDVARHPAAVRERIGCVFQHSALDDALTVRENLHFHGSLYGLRGERLRERIRELLSIFELRDRAGDAVSTLSGGLRRRADLARGLLHRPPVLLLDEPTVGLDPAARRTFWRALERLRRDDDVTLVVATHLMNEAERCDEVAILNEGRCVANGSPACLKAGLGDETLWLHPAGAPTALRNRVEAQFGAETTVIGERVQVTSEDAPALLSSVYESLGDQIEEATVRKPTLEDVFLVRTASADAPSPSETSLRV
jgi:ABC-2 type transport system ATP-binding protein